MVVIRRKTSEIEEAFGSSFLMTLRDFSNIIGFSVDIDDEVKVELNPDRIDLASFHSMNRAMNLFYQRKNSPIQITWSGNHLMDISKETLSLRPFIIYFVARGPPLRGKMQDLIEFQERIHNSIGKDRKKVSIGLHDLDSIRPPFRYISSDLDSTIFTTYDGLSGSIREIMARHPKGISYAGLIESKDRAPLIVDSEGSVLSVPPVINGNKSLVGSGTSNLFVDITGTDFRAMRDAFYLLIGELSSYGFSISIPDLNLTKPMETYLREFHNRAIQLNLKEIDRVLGARSRSVDPVNSLTRMGFLVSQVSQKLVVMVPGNRIDIMGPVDLIEDYAKAAGFDNIPEKEPQIPTSGSRQILTRNSDSLRSLGIGMGFQEVMTFVVTTSKYYRSREYRGGISILNPKSVDNSVIRDRLYLNILELFFNNKNRGYPQRVFEIGYVVADSEEEQRICFGLTGSRASINDARRYAEYILRRISGREIKYRQDTSPDFIPGRFTQIFLGQDEVGFMGEVHPSVLEEFELQMPAAFVELYVDKISTIKES